MKKSKANLTNKNKKIFILSFLGGIVFFCGASLKPHFYSLNPYFLGSFLCIFWIAFSFGITRMRLVSDDFYSCLLKDAKTYLPFIFLPLIHRIDFLWLHILLVLVMGSFFFLKGFFLKWKAQEKDIFQKSAILILFIITVLYIANYSYLSIIQYNAFYSGHWDLVGFDQAIWNTIRGKPLHTTLYKHNFLGEHMSPILIILAPFYLIWNDPRMLLILQSIFLGLGAIPIFLIAKDKLKHNFLSLSFSFAYLSHLLISRSNLYEFHEIALAPLFLLFCFFFLQRKNWVSYFIFLVLSLLVKEDVSLIITTLGIYAFFKQNKKIGIITIIIGMLWAYLSVKILIPYIRVVTGKGTQEASYGYFERLNLGETPFEVIKNIILKPENTLKRLFLPANEKFTTLFLLILPVGLLASLEILLALPEILLHFLSGWDFQQLLLMHYSTPIIPFLIISGIYGAFWIRRYIKKISTGLAIYILACSFISNYYFCAPIFNAYVRDVKYYPKERKKAFFSILPQEMKCYYQNLRKIKIYWELKRMIPKDASISVQDNLLAHFSHQKFFIFPEFENSDYVLLSSFSCGSGVVMWHTTPEAYNKAVNALLSNNPNFSVIFADSPFTMGIFPGIVLCGKKERKNEIINCACELVKKRPNSYSHFVLGSVYFHTNNLKEAKEELKTSLFLDSKNTYAQQMLDAINKNPF